MVPATGSGAVALRLSVRDVSAAEGRRAVFTVRLSRPAKGTVKVRYRTRNGTARAPGDFRAASGTVIFKRGQRTKRVSVPLSNDLAVEGSERFSLRLSAPRGARLARRVAQATILDDDGMTTTPPPPPPPPPPTPPPVPTLSVADLSLTEGSAGTTPASFTVVLSAPSASPVVVSYSTSDGTATAGADYVGASGSLAFAAGETSKQLAVGIVGDTADEPDETFSLQLSAAGATLADTQALATLIDDDLPVADLSVTLADDSDPVLSGAPLTYTLTVGNAGPQTAQNVRVVDDLPAGLTFVSAVASVGSCSYAAPRVTCQLGAIATGGGRTVDLVVEPTSSGLIQTTASVAGDYLDPAGANDSDTETTQVDQAADVSVTLGDSADPLLGGEELTYSLGVSNRGPFAAADPVAVVALPAGVTFMSASPGCAHTSGTVTCGAGALGSSLGPGADVLLTIVVSRTAAIAETLTATATVSTSAPPDPDPADNTDSETTGYVPAGDLEVSMTRAPDAVDTGDDLSWIVTVTNRGPNPANAVVLQDTLPAGFTYESVSTTQGSCSRTGLVVDCPLGTLASGDTVTVTIAGRPAAGSTDTDLTNAATASSSAADPDSANNSDTDTVGVNARLSINDMTVAEPKGIYPIAGTPRTAEVTLTVTLSRVSSRTVTVAWTTADGTATQPGDYFWFYGTLSFAPGQTTREITVTVASDGSMDALEGNESFFINLSSPVNASVADAQGVITIVE